jgi:hypothetical protein
MTRHQDSPQIWALLICAARGRKDYTCSQVAEILGFGRAGVLGALLGPIMWFCHDRNLLPLTMFVLSQRTGLPAKDCRHWRM